MVGALPSNRCETCRRRKVKCDEAWPVCGPCQRRNRVCPPRPSLKIVDCTYDVAGKKSATDESTIAKGTVWPAVLQENCQVWLDSEIRSGAASPSLPPSLSLYAHKLEDLRHIYHIHLINSSLQLSNTLSTTLWGRQLPMYLSLSSSDHVAHALMALSACRLAWMCQSPELDRIARHYQTMALRRVEQQVRQLCTGNSDAILSTLILLSTESDNFRQWTTVMKSMLHVIDFIEGRMQKPSILYDNHISQYGPDNILSSQILDTRRLLGYFLVSIDAFPPCVKRRSGLSSPIAGLYRTAVNFQQLEDNLTLEEQYIHMYPLRSWLNWFPDSLVPLTQGDAWVLVLLAHFYSFTLAVIPMFPVVNTRIFIAMRVKSTMSILESICDTKPYYCSKCAETHAAQHYMQFPNQVMEAFGRLNYGAGPYDDPLSGVYTYSMASMYDSSEPCATISNLSV